MADGENRGAVELENEAGGFGFAGYTFVGADANDQAGYSVSSAGDVDGDGYDDLIIGAPELTAAFQEGGGKAYLVLAADLAAFDAADGTTDGLIELANVGGHGASYQFVGAGTHDEAGYSVSSAGDVDNDGLDDLLIGARVASGYDDSINTVRANSGEAYLVLARDLAAVDAADGASDGVVDLGNVSGHTGSYLFVGSEASDSAGYSVSSAGDVDGDGRDDLFIGAPDADGGGEGSGEAYLVLAADLAAADAADGVSDGVVDLDKVSGHTGSYQLVGASAGDAAGYSVSSAGDVDGDGRDDLIIGAYRADGGASDLGATYLLLAADLASMDAADGAGDGIIDLGNVTGRTGSYTFVGAEVGDLAGNSVSSAGDVDGDGRDDLIIGARVADGGGEDSGEAYLVLSADLAAVDAADGASDGVVDLGNVSGHTGSYLFVGSEASDRAAYSVSSAGDVDGDGRDDLFIGARDAKGEGYFSGTGSGNGAGEAYLVLAADLAAADGADGSADGIIDLDNVSGHTGSYQFVGAETHDAAGSCVSSAGDVDGDGRDDLIFGAPWGGGEAYLVLSADLAAADAADGVTDGVIDLANMSTRANSAPVAVADSASTDEDTSVSGNVLTGAGADSDADGDALSVTAVNGVAGDVGSQITLASGALLTLNADGSYDYDPNGAFESLTVGRGAQIATDSFSYTVSDGNGGTDTATVTVNVSGVNDTPVITVSDVVLAPGDSIRLSDIVEVTDVDFLVDYRTEIYSTDGYKVQLIDDTGPFNFVYGSAMPTGGHAVNTVTVVADSVQTTQTLSVRVSDGRGGWSDWATFTLTTDAGPGWFFGWYYDAPGWAWTYGAYVDWDYGWHTDWAYGWHIDWEFGWYFDGAYGWHIDWTYGWSVDWDYGWHIDWAFGWSIDWDYGWSFDWTYGWHIDWGFGWTIDWDYGWHIDWGWAWAPSVGWVYSWAWDYGWSWAWDYGWSWAWDYGWTGGWAFGRSWSWDYGWGWSWDYGWSWSASFGWSWSWDYGWSGSWAYGWSWAWDYGWNLAQDYGWSWGWETGWHWAWLAQPGWVYGPYYGWDFGSYGYSWDYYSWAGVV